MQRSTFLGLMAFAVWAAAMGAGYARPLPDKCAVCHSQTAVQDLGRSNIDAAGGDPASEVAATDPTAFKPAQVRVSGYLFSKPPDGSGIRAFGKSAHPLETDAFATTGLRG